MLIGIDIDNTLNDFSQAVAKYLDPIVGKDTEPLLKEHLWISKAVDWEDEDVVDFFGRYAERIHMEADTKDSYTTPIINGLYLRGFDMTIITNRQKERVGFDVEAQTAKWLKLHKLDLYFNDIHFVKDCKHEYHLAKKLGIECMIEDNLERSIPFVENGIPVILFNYGYNQGYEHKNLHRVDNWWEAYQKLIKLERELFDNLWQRSSS